METFIIELDPQKMSNPDADIRYRLPDLIVERSGGVIVDDGYDYVGEQPLMLLFLNAPEFGPAFGWITDVIENTRVLENDLRPVAVVAVLRDGRREVVYPAELLGGTLMGS